MNSEIINDIVCPVGKKELTLEKDFLVCTYCSVKFPVKDGIPVLIIDEAILPEGIKSVNELKCMMQ